MNKNRLKSKKNNLVIAVISIILILITIATIYAVYITKNNKTIQAIGEMIENENIENIENVEEIENNSEISTNELSNKTTETNENKNKNGNITNQNRTSYYIKINNAANVVTIYTKDENGNYTKPVKAMVCSTGTATPQSGKYKLNGTKHRWGVLFGNVHGQYTTAIVGNILFHSVPYTKYGDPSSLEYWEYDKLGTKASAGCIRLTVQDAMWIYNNISKGTIVEFYSDSNPGPLGKPGSQKISGNTECRGWDPTDPNKKNPWKNNTNKTQEKEPIKQNNVTTENKQDPIKQNNVITENKNVIEDKNETTNENKVNATQNNIIEKNVTTENATENTTENTTVNNTVNNIKK